ncbi:hypothetical protein KOR34_02090 [Posidoniimonas corsicana]|uniref:Uncharacterized protein n=1 Tax=Posidoniimonas corsicana TaxID=1938618 RepID=A0A5C5VBW1_9BACT|nr:hypothetical protein [Posidoniimonas corsicana]TWT35319.1 hypothetical protein KOR34_02090 [Posidoniimonas corsicana]
MRGTPTVRPRQWNQALRAAGEDVGVYWHIHYRPKRFSEQAYSEYGARKRSRPYRRKKVAEKGHNRPLDYSGEARRDSQQRKVGAAVRRRGGLEVWIRGPRKLNYRPRTKGRRRPIDMRSEWRAWSPRERVKLQKVLRQRIVYHLRRIGSNQRVTVRLNA